MRGSWWRVLGVVIVLNVVAGIFGLIIQTPFMAMADAADSGAIALVGTILGNAVTLSFVALAGTLLYFDLRVRAGGPVLAPAPARAPAPEVLPGGFEPPRPDDQE